MTVDRRHITGWLAGGATARGSSHHRSGLPNQDAIGWIQPTAGLMHGALVVSDGHGGRPHDLSHIGSRLAVEAALAEFAPLIAEQPEPNTGFAAAHEGLPNRMHLRWQSRILELSGLADAKTMVRYGATLVAVAASRNELLLVQIGDGDIIIGRANGEITRPLPDDIGLIGEQTHSLCEANAPLTARTRIIPIGSGATAIDFIMVSTDGLAKSFADDDAFLDLARHYRGLIAKRGLGAVTDGLGDWLSAASASGSGDDTTVGFFISPSLHTQAQRKVNDHEPASNTRPTGLPISLIASLLMMGSLVGATAVHWAHLQKPVTIHPKPASEPATQTPPKTETPPRPASAPEAAPKPADQPQTIPAIKP